MAKVVKATRDVLSSNPVPFLETNGSPRGVNKCAFLGATLENIWERPETNPGQLVEKEYSYHCAWSSRRVNMAPYEKVLKCY